MSAAMSPHVTSLTDMVRIVTARSPSAVAIEHDHGTLTYGQFWDRSVRLANVMLARGLKAGDRVALFAQNRHEYLESYVGLLLAGLVAVPANYRLTPTELAFLLENSGARGLLVGEEYLAHVQTVRESGARMPQVVIVYGSDASHENSYGRAIAAAATSLPPRVAGLNDPAAIFYTSGTTGFPKGAVMSRGRCFGCRSWRHAQDLAQGPACGAARSSALLASSTASR